MSRAVLAALMILLVGLAGCGMRCLTCEVGDPALAATNDDATCRSYGVAPGSPGYVQCRMNLENNRAALVTTAMPLLLRH